MTDSGRNYLSSAGLQDPQTFLTTVPLYEEFHLTFIDRQEVEAIEFFDGPLDTYCTECQRVSTFRGANSPYVPPTPGGARTISTHHTEPPHPLRDRIISLHFFCSRNAEHTMHVYIKIINEQLSKIGQYPSLADVELPQTNKYSKALGSTLLHEFRKAIGLAAHGVGIGSFVYLRRIFENLVEEAHGSAKNDVDWDEGIYMKARMDEKISLLKDHLPTFLVENKGLYSILSKGIHELDEKECLSYFEIMRLGIELILDEKLEQQEKRLRAEKAAKAIAAIQQNLK